MRRATRITSWVHKALPFVGEVLHPAHFLPTPARESTFNAATSNGGTRSQAGRFSRVIGSRGVVSLVVNGKRGISKAQAKALGEFFHVSHTLFF